MIINAAILEDNILFANQLKNLILIWADKNSHNFNIDVFHSAENLFSGNTKYTYYDVIFMIFNYNLMFLQLLQEWILQKNSDFQVLITILFL